jgi:hypothetical protein
MSRNEKIINYCLMLAVSAVWLVVWSWSAWDCAADGWWLAFCLSIGMTAGWGVFIKEWANMIRLTPLVTAQ